MINIEQILLNAIELRASDIHIVAGLPPIFRKNRKLDSMDYASNISKEDMQDIIRFLLNNNKEMLNAFETERKIDFNFEIQGTRLRVNLSFSNGVPVITARIVENVLPRFASLGLPDVVMKNALLPQGLILVTGKSNSGKSTTLNAIVNEINLVESKKILMLENPIEFVHTPRKSLIVQKEIGPGKDCNSFSEGAVNALREDCDILIIGEIRDKETMDAAFEMAESGHLVIGTMHTRSCAETIDRVFNFYELSELLPVKYMLSSLLRLIVSQRLLNSLNGNLVMVPEIMVVDDIISAIIRKEKFTKSELEDAMQTRFDKGNISFVNSLANMINAGHISVEQAKKQLDDKNYETLLRILNQSNIADRRWQL